MLFADPGYRADGKKRYPLDTVGHCTAAWGHIKKNHQHYTEHQLTAIRNRIQGALLNFGVVVEDDRPVPLLNDPAMLRHYTSKAGIPLYSLDVDAIRGFCVYLLIDVDGTVIYVGQSTNLLGRLGDHLRNPEKRDCATIQILRCDSKNHMDDVETALIKLYRPKLNTRGVS